MGLSVTLYRLACLCATLGLATAPGHAQSQPDRAPDSVTAKGTVASVVELPGTSVEVVSGVPINIQITVASGDDGPVPTGVLRIYYENTQLTSAALNANGVANISLSTAGAAAGTYELSASYSGDSTYLPSTASGSITILAQQNTIALLSVGPSYYESTYVIGDIVPLQATVYAYPNFYPVTGTITFTSGNSEIGVAEISAGAASLNLNTASLSAGTYPLHAVYSGDAKNLPSSTDSSFILVAATATQIYMNVSGGYDPIFLQGDVATVTVYVTPTTGNGRPTGMVTVLGNGVPVGIAGLASDGSTRGSIAVLNLSTAGFAPGAYTVSSSYSGDARNMASTYTDTEQQITIMDVTVTAVSASPNPVSHGATAFLAVEVRAPNRSQVPVGTIDFSYAGNSLGSVTLGNSGSATFPLSTSGLSPGSYLITATYSGEFSESSSATVTLVVQ